MRIVLGILLLIVALAFFGWSYQRYQTTHTWLSTEAVVLEQTGSQTVRDRNRSGHTARRTSEETTYHYRIEYAIAGRPDPIQTRHSSQTRLWPGQRHTIMVNPVNHYQFHWEQGTMIYLPLLFIGLSIGLAGGYFLATGTRG